MKRSEKEDELGWGLQPLPVKRIPQLPLELEVEIGIQALGTGGSDHADTLDAKAPEGHAYLYEGCKGKSATSLCPERNRRIPFKGAGRVADMVPTR
ncbi:hypothetical protein E2C01_055126 [Portunus trituberculatus]|uniref:Uncharacterized protein n=1 Tax=Portunus trituberculatus TaxID=210409 RepID=A0A5B7GTW0_PORTR|nr:hypothetical protein [Portunus trituberculatus]